MMGAALLLRVEGGEVFIRRFDRGDVTEPCELKLNIATARPAIAMAVWAQSGAAWCQDCDREFV